MAITASLVKELRERTQAGLNDCRSALIEAQGDLDQAVEIILKKGLAKSAKRAGAVAADRGRPDDGVQDPSEKVGKAFGVDPLGGAAGGAEECVVALASPLK